jgi:hypothetical protein
VRAIPVDGIRNGYKATCLMDAESASPEAFTKEHIRDLSHMGVSCATIDDLIKAHCRAGARGRGRLYANEI